MSSIVKTQGTIAWHQSSAHLARRLASADIKHRLSIHSVRVSLCAESKSLFAAHKLNWPELTFVRNTELSLNCFCRELNTFHFRRQYKSTSTWSGVLVTAFGYKSTRTANFWTELNWTIDPITRRVHWSRASASRPHLVLIDCSETRTASVRLVLSAWSSVQFMYCEQSLQEYRFVVLQQTTGTPRCSDDNAAIYSTSFSFVTQLPYQWCQHPSLAVHANSSKNTPVVCEMSCYRVCKDCFENTQDWKALTRGHTDHFSNILAYHIIFGVECETDNKKFYT